MLRKQLDEITAGDINEFVGKTKLPESAILDYKRDYNLQDSKEKKGFLADICAFGNNGGGHVLVGVDEERDEHRQKTGLPVDPPRGAKAFDKSVAEDIIHASIDPRLGSFVNIQTVQGSWAEGPVHVIRIERTWNPPHCVTGGEKRTFYRRSGTKSEPMNMDQIRESFLGAATLGERIQQFRRDRVRRVQEGSTTFPLDDEPGRTIVHVVPVNYFASGDRLALDQASEYGIPFTAPNFDGRIAIQRNHASNKTFSYTQLFRDGTIEAVHTGIVTRSEGSLLLKPAYVERYVLDTLRKARAFFDSQPDIGPSYLILLTLVDVRQSHITFGAVHPPAGEHAIELDDLWFPDVMTHDLAGDMPALMRLTFDMMWQAGGWERSQSYDGATGKYKTG